MAQNSKIGWTTHSANLWWGCVEVSPACDNCYAREWAKRYDRAKWGANEPRLKINGVWNDLKKYQHDAAEAGRIDRVFVGSMMDIFEKAMPVVDSKGESLVMMTSALRQELFGRIDAGLYPNLLFLLLTKRAGNIPAMIPESWRNGAPNNVMFGTSVVTQPEVDREVPKLAKVPGRRFLSIEPLLEPVDLSAQLSAIEWAIVGVESRGSRAGRFAEGYPLAARAIIEQCATAGVLVFHKQMPINGKVDHDPATWPDGLRVQMVPTLGQEARR